MTFRVIAFLCLFSTVALAQAKTIDDFVAPFAKANHFSGVVLAEKDGKVIYEKAFGLANAEHNVPNKLNTKFGIASITKPMTSVVLLRLIEAGKISPADKLSKFIPDFPNGDKITIEMIARHRSGIPHRVMPNDEETKRFTPEQFVERVKKAKLEFEPGTDDLYSSAGYAVLARTLEIASGESFQDLLRKYVFAPAGMNDTEDFDSAQIMKNRAECYLLGGEGYTAAPLKDYSFLVGAGSVFSTARDIQAFAQATIDGKFGASAKANLVRNGVFRSNGSTNGYRANVRADVNKKFTYVVVSNMASGANDVIISGLRNFLEGKEVPKPKIPQPKIDPKVKNNLDDYVGRYKLSSSGFDILINGGELFAGPFKLLPMGKDKFYNFFGYAEVTFVRDEKGKVTGLTWAGSAGKTDWTRE
ncbi:MAG: serine hydrolase [Pyrinomonadaceae bacterium]|nr:serine hydrolase [Pyrinomonadaceae bacterium]